MRRLIKADALREILLPLGRMAIFVLGAGALLSVVMVVLSLLFRGSGADKLLQTTQGVNIFTYTMANLPQVLIDGVTLGFVYAAIALGYTMVYGVLEFINFAHSEIFALGAFAGVEFLIILDQTGVLKTAGGMSPYLYLVLALIVSMAASGGTAVFIERVAYRPLRNAPRLVPLISAIGVSFALQDIIRLTESLTTGQFYRVIPTFGNFDDRIPLFSIPTGGAPIRVDIQVKSLVVIAAAMFMLVGLNYIVNATRIGKAIRSVAQDRNTAAIMGIGVNGIISFTFLLGGSLGGAAGVLYALKFTRIDPFVGFMPGMKAFTAAVLGGIGNLTGALLGGIVLGMLESFAGAYLGTFTMGNFGSEYKDILAFLILIIVIIFRPSGLLGEQVSQKA
ncbi:MAG TPA: branched-chain amino acid ABC transporter permease [Spirochaetia bacterium]|nr:branched-chain amino acid ABC transporter permease [Spirochaetales bacterium]HRY79146.1 branched-chain amino acid ABC transporter permease [Spirochaetia bacterium]HRZ90381.1 branched-chain amino acid ABC transporter permease [Spirochaetia bacterium]